MNKKYFVIGLVLICILISVKVFLSFIFVPPILMYHALDEDEHSTKLNLSPSGFEKQMGFFYRHKYNVVSLEEMVTLIKTKKRIPPKTVTITFDDGYKNNYKYGYPVLKKYGFPATIFVITDFIGKEGYLTWDDLRELQRNNITIGSHTLTHVWLPSIDEESMRREILGSKEVLERNTGKEIKFISYPLGAHNEKVKSMVKTSGYMAACGTNPGKAKRWDDIYALKRIRISRTSNNLLVLWIESSGYYTFIKEVRDD